MSARIDRSRMSKLARVIADSGQSAVTATTAAMAITAATNTVVNDTTTNATVYPTWVTANSGDLPVKVSSTKLSFNPSTGVLTATGFSGPLTGNVTGNASGSAGSCTGNAATATSAAKLTTARAINGVNFDGSAPITVTADANTLSGTTLKSTVVTSSLTSVGTLTSLRANLVGVGRDPYAPYALFAQGLSNTSSDYGFVVQNSLGQNLFMVRNDGAVGVHKAPTTGYDLDVSGSALFGGNVGIGTAAPTSPLQVVTLPTYATNAAALAGGLTAGAFFKVNVAGEYFVHVVV